MNHSSINISLAGGLLSRIGLRILLSSLFKLEDSLTVEGIENSPFIIFLLRSASVFAYFRLILPLKGNNPVVILNKMTPADQTSALKKSIFFFEISSGDM